MIFKFKEPKYLALRFTSPFNSDISKNRKYTVNRYNHKIVISTKYKKAFGEIQFVVQQAMEKAGIESFPMSKLYIVAKVYKPNNRFDAANLIDGLFDVLDKTIGVNDRYYSGAFDWDIDKNNPRIEVAIFLDSLIEQKIDHNTLKLVDKN